MLPEIKRKLTNIGKDGVFSEIIEKLTINSDLTFEEKTYILSCAILMLKQYERDKRYTSYADFSFYILLKYSLLSKDYSPLYDFSVNFGFFPIAKYILDNQLLEDYNLKNCFIDTNINRFRNEKEYIETLEQHNESQRILKEKKKEKSFVAPTSFGKSYLIIDFIKQLPNKDNKIGIIVPTKSLLMQTCKMIRKANLRKKVIIHDEMYNNEISFIAIFTQERALRLLSKNVYFDVLFIDEAHNILKKDDRSILLSRLIAQNSNNNPNDKVVYLSPLVYNADNYKHSNDQNISSYNIKFNIKEPEIYEYEITGKINKYSRFVNKFYHIGFKSNKFVYIQQESKNKNFLYEYRPILIEELSRELCKYFPKIVVNDQIANLIKILKREVHEEFYIVKYLEHGVIYLHGKLPDLIKEYLENKFREIKDIKYVVANSVILEGMNLPIDSLFICNTYSLTGKTLMNLIGRVNRLSHIFQSKENVLGKLVPQIHFINAKEYTDHNNKIKILRSRNFEDKVENPILENFNIEEQVKTIKDPEEKQKVIKKIQQIQNNEKFIHSNNTSEQEVLKQYLIESGISNYYDDVDKYIELMNSKIKTIKSKVFYEWNNKNMMEKIYYLFIQNIENVTDYEFSRLVFEEARDYYENHILIDLKKSLNENINSQYKYFQKLAKKIDSKLYMGASYGEEPYNSEVYSKSEKKVYVNLAKKEDFELINLAIVKLKIEEDFISFKINKAIVMLYEYDLISKDEYNKYIYGTNDEKKIELTKYGLSISLISRLEKDGQLNNLYFDEYNNLKANPIFELFKDGIDDFYRFEINRYLN